MNDQQRWIRRQIFRVAAEGRELPADSEEHAASILLVIRMWDAFNEAVNPSKRHRCEQREIAA